MPGGDRTGPVGRGPMMGRGAGFCAGYGVSGFMNPGKGAGGAFFGGRGGLGRRNRFFATNVPGWRCFAGNPIPGEMSFSSQPGTPQDEWEALKGQAQYLENCLKEFQRKGFLLFYGGDWAQYLENSLKELQARVEAMAPEKKTE